jgi:hypothetical protein
MVLLQAHLKNHCVPPNYRNIGAGIGVRCKKKIGRTLASLERAGLLKRGPKVCTLELLPAKYHDATNCVCVDCADVRYLARLKLIEALEVLPPIALAGKLVGLRSPKSQPPQKSRMGAL